MNGRINIAIQVCNNGLLLTQFAENMLSDSSRPLISYAGWQSDRTSKNC